MSLGAHHRSTGAIPVSSGNPEPLRQCVLRCLWQQGAHARGTGHFGVLGTVSSECLRLPMPVAPEYPSLWDLCV